MTIKLYKEQKDHIKKVASFYDDPDFRSLIRTCDFQDWQNNSNEEKKEFWSNFDHLFSNFLSINKSKIDFFNSKSAGNLFNKDAVFSPDSNTIFIRQETDSFSEELIFYLHEKRHHQQYIEIEKFDSIFHQDLRANLYYFHDGFFGGYLSSLNNIKGDGKKNFIFSSAYNLKGMIQPVEWDANIIMFNSLLFLRKHEELLGKYETKKLDKKIEYLHEQFNIAYFDENSSKIYKDMVKQLRDDFFYFSTLHKQDVDLANEDILKYNKDNVDDKLYEYFNENIYEFLDGKSKEHLIEMLKIKEGIDASYHFPTKFKQKVNPDLIFGGPIYLKKGLNEHLEEMYLKKYIDQFENNKIAKTKTNRKISQIFYASRDRYKENILKDYSWGEPAIDYFLDKIKDTELEKLSIKLLFQLQKEEKKTQTRQKN